MRSAVAILCAMALFACSRETQVADVDTTTVSATSATVDTSATSTSATIDPATATVVTVDRSWGAWGDWDTDKNDQLARNEFDGRFDTVYDRWDADRSRALSRDELADTWYDLWDNNNDNFIDEQEWTRGSRNWNFDGVDFRSWRQWDVDNDGRADANEFRQGFRSIYDVFDTDRNDNITREELRQRWWDLFDGNDDNMIDASEWRARTGAS